MSASGGVRAVHRLLTYAFPCAVGHSGYAYPHQAGRGPFTVKDGDTDDDNNATLSSFPALPEKQFSPAARSVLHGLLTRDPASRLGCGDGGVKEIMVRMCSAACWTPSTGPVCDCMYDLRVNGLSL